PACARLTATARPMPPPPPVTTETRPDRPSQSDEFCPVMMVSLFCARETSVRPSSRFKKVPSRLARVRGKGEDARPPSRRALRASFIPNFLSSECRGRRECRALGAPAASRATKKAHEHSHHGHAGITRAFPAQWFTAYSVLSPVTGLFCHCRLRIAPQAWRQRRGVRTTRLCRPPQRRSSRALPASTASRLTSVTIA